MRILLARHGATAWNREGRFLGRTDPPLAEEGRRQAERLAAAVAPHAPARAYASPLSRARETARAAWGEPEALEDLAEIDRGEWEGLTLAEARARWPELCAQWYADPAGLAMPGGESFDALWERAGRAAARVAAGDGVALVVAHKAVNRVILARLLGLPTRGVWGIPQPEACLSVLVRENGAWRAETLGDVAHLRG